MLKFFKENSDNVFLLGVAFIIIGAAVFFGATPRGQKLNNPGEAWMLAAPLVALGASLLIFHWHLQR
jgi:uncharacterized membrane protein HdeD (DUF308 family)